MAEITPHPVAHLLTPEMRARVRAATFKRHRVRRLRATILAKVGTRWACPLGVAIGLVGSPSPGQIALAIGGEDLLRDDSAYDTINNFTMLIDNGKVRDPADVYVMLGVEPPTDGAPATGRDGGAS